MRYLHLITVLSFVLASGCATTSPTGQVERAPGSQDVEIVSQERLANGWGEDCERLGNVRVSTGPFSEYRSQGTLSWTEVKARNQAHRMGATHVAVGNGDVFACRSDGKHCGSCGGECFELSGTAFNCEGSE